MTTLFICLIRFQRVFKTTIIPFRLTAESVCYCLLPVFTKFYCNFYFCKIHVRIKQTLRIWIRNSNRIHSKLMKKSSRIQPILPSRKTSCAKLSRHSIVRREGSIDLLKKPYYLSVYWSVRCGVKTDRLVPHSPVRKSPPIFGHVLTDALRVVSLLIVLISTGLW